MQKRTFSTERLFKRFSQITGIPISELKPIIDRSNTDPNYNISTHSVRSIRNESVLSHEYRHGLQILSRPQEFVPGLKSVNSKSRIGRLKKKYAFQKKAVQWLEPTNANPNNNLYLEALANYSQGFTALPRVTVAGLALSAIKYGYPIRGLALLSTLLPSFIQTVKRQSRVRNLFEKHGEDAILLLWVSPPKKMDALQVPIWEKQMVQNGYLESNGGITKKGLRFWRENLQAQAIWLRLGQMRAIRQKFKVEEPAAKTKTRLRPRQHTLSRA
ncbi:MAG: hypothetical protein V1777_01720 [Candidatus Micrarchaeota archaeon]